MITVTIRCGENESVAINVDDPESMTLGELIAQFYIRASRTLEKSLFQQYIRNTELVSFSLAPEIFLKPEDLSKKLISLDINGDREITAKVPDYRNCSIAFSWQMLVSHFKIHQPDAAKEILRAIGAHARANEHKKNALHYMAELGIGLESTTTISKDIDIKKDIHEKDSLGLTPLHLAAENGYAEGVRTLLELKADPNAKAGAHAHLSKERGRLTDSSFVPNVSFEAQNCTPLHHIAKAAELTPAHLDVLKNLLAAHAQVNARDCYDNTLLILLASNKETLSELMLKELIIAGADVNLLGRDKRCGNALGGRLSMALDTWDSSDKNYCYAPGVYYALLAESPNYRLLIEFGGAGLGARRSRWFFGPKTFPSIIYTEDEAIRTYLIERGADIRHVEIDEIKGGLRYCDEASSEDHFKSRKDNPYVQQQKAYLALLYYEIFVSFLFEGAPVLSVCSGLEKSIWTFMWQEDFKGKFIEELSQAPKKIQALYDVALHHQIRKIEQMERTVKKNGLSGAIKILNDLKKVVQRSNLYRSQHFEQFLINRMLSASQEDRGIWINIATSIIGRHKVAPYLKPLFNQPDAKQSIPTVNRRASAPNILSEAGEAALSPSSRVLNRRDSAPDTLSEDGSLSSRPMVGRFFEGTGTAQLSTSDMSGPMSSTRPPYGGLFVRSVADSLKFKLLEMLEFMKKHQQLIPELKALKTTEEIQEFYKQHPDLRPDLEGLIATMDSSIAKSVLEESLSWLKDPENPLNKSASSVALVPEDKSSARTETRI